MKPKPLLFAAATLASNHVVAQEAWNWTITPYLWAAGISGTVSAVDIEAELSVDFEDLVNVLQGGALLKIEAASASNGVFADIVFLALEEEEARDTIGGTLEADLDSWIVEAGYRRFTSERFALDVGARYWQFDTELTPAVAPVVKTSRDWTDGFVGARFAGSLGGNWGWVVRGNVGAGGSDLALGFELDLRHEFASGNRFNIGLRALDLDFEDSAESGDPLEVDMTFSGLVIGYTFDL